MKRTGIIVKGIGGFYYVLIDDEIVECKARGLFRKDGIIPMVGDKVKLAQDVDLIEEILPRKNKLTRPAVANIDYLGIVIASRNPAPDYLLVDKLIVYACMQNIEPIIIINKVDIGEKSDIDQILNMYAGTGWHVLPVSCKTGEGIEELSYAFSDGITTLAGQSGVGKSSLLNALHPSLNLEVGEISEKLKRGKHTTRYVELLSLPHGGMVVDTPGFSFVAIKNIDERVVGECYPEFEKYRYDCRFGVRCIHKNEPDCNIKKHVEKGIISEARYDRYIKILEEIEERGVEYR